MELEGGGIPWRVESSADRRQRKVRRSGAAGAGFPLADRGKEAALAPAAVSPCVPDVAGKRSKAADLRDPPQVTAQTFTIPGGLPVLLVI